MENYKDLSRTYRLSFLPIIQTCSSDIPLVPN
jgi:hypothetical protein